MGEQRVAPAAKRRLRLFESLESRVLLSAEGLVAPDVVSVAGHFIGDGHDHSHADLRYNADGLAYFVDPAYPETGGGHDCGCSCPACSVAVDAVAVVHRTGEPVATLDEVPAYNSNPDAPHTYYLDFNSHVVSGTAWNSYNRNQPIHAVAYDTDGDKQSFNQSELDDIFEIWSRVSEDLLPFNINVTTVEPPAEAFTQGRDAIRAVISTNVDDAAMGGSGQTWFANAGGVAFLRSWRWVGDVPVWGFYNQLPQTAKAVAEVVSHEFGHAVGLSHDGTPGTTYYAGHGSGETGWAPIMGVGYYREVTQWSKGEYGNANNQEDDLAIITSPINLITYREDDHGVGAEATPIVLEDGKFLMTGVIEQAGDTDEFRIEHPGGPISVAATTQNNGFGANLDLMLTLVHDGSEETPNIVSRSAPLGTLSAHLQLADLAPGTYFLQVTGDSGPGYSQYASIGGYSIEAEISSSIHGIKVHGDSNQPIEGISFELRTTGGTLLRTDTTDENGEFDFQDINPGTYRIVELDSGQPTDTFASFLITVASGEVHVWQSGEAGTVPVGQTEVANSQLVIQNTLEGSIHGEVTDALGVALAGVQLSLTNGAGNILFGTTASGANGSFAFDDLAPGTYLVTALADGFVSSQTTVVVSSGEEETSSPLPADTLELGQYETINTDLSFLMEAINDAPVVTEVKVGSTFWTTASSTNNFTGYVDPTDGLGYEIPTGYATVPSLLAQTSQSSVLPWRNIDKLYVEFSEDVQPPTGGWSSPGVIAIFNSANAAIPVSNISYDSTNFRLTITTANALGDDRYLLAIDDTITDADGAALDGEFGNGTDTLFGNLGTSGDGTAGTKFEFLFNVQHADASGSGSVDVTDLSRLGTGFGGRTGNVAATANYNPYADFNGSGAIDVTDLSILGTNFGDSTIPSTPVPTNPLFLRSNAAVADAVFGES